jgi:hypothetical protein
MFVKARALIIMMIITLVQVAPIISYLNICQTAKMKSCAVLIELLRTAPCTY